MMMSNNDDDNNNVSSMSTSMSMSMSMSKSSLHGKVAVITGSTQGLGEATARLFKERGCQGIVISGRNAQRGQQLVKELNDTTNDNDCCTVIFVPADLAQLDDCRNLIKVADATFHRIDILVNAAGTSERCSIYDTTPAQYDHIMNVNTRAPFFLMQDVARIMERNNNNSNTVKGGGGGSIINISSTASYGSMPMIAPYGMSKGALNVATKNAAYAFMWSRIRVNALAIGWMDSPGEDDIQQRMHSTSTPTPTTATGSDGTATAAVPPPNLHWKAVAEPNQPFGRLLKCEEVARMIAFCASDESGMMTGCVIDFDQSVFGCGNAPVPPPKSEWTRANNGMTFTFHDDNDSNSNTNDNK